MSNVEKLNDPTWTGSTELRIRINLDNDAFEELETRGEVARCLSRVAAAYDGGKTTGSVVDTNGNTVGEWEVACED